MVQMELSVQKVTTASRVTQAHVEPGACQEPTEYVVNAVNQAILALMVSLALLASKENRYLCLTIRLSNWGDFYEVIVNECKG